MIYIVGELQARDVWERKRSIKHGVAMNHYRRDAFGTARGNLAHDFPGDCSRRVS